MENQEIRKKAVDSARQVIVKAGTRLLTSRESIAELAQVALRQLLHVEHVAVPLWAAMYGKVLGTSQQLFIFAFGC